MKKPSITQIIFRYYISSIKKELKEKGYDPELFDYSLSDYSQIFAYPGYESSYPARYIWWLDVPFYLMYFSLKYLSWFAILCLAGKIGSLLLAQASFLIFYLTKGTSYYGIRIYAQPKAGVQNPYINGKRPEYHYIFAR